MPKPCILTSRIADVFLPSQSVISMILAEPASLRMKNSMRCQVCFEDCDAEDLALCNVCNISVHKSCYMGENEVIDQAVGWRCDPCKCGVDFCGTVCRVCPITGGAFKRMVGASNDWVHLPCVSFFFCRFEIWDKLHILQRICWNRTVVLHG
jgi:hypothetical protein